MPYNNPEISHSDLSQNLLKSGNQYKNGFENEITKLPKIIRKSVTLVFSRNL